MDITRLIEGLNIFNKYFDDPERALVSADREVIGVANTDKPISPEDLKRLFELDWFQPDANWPEQEEGTFEDVLPEYAPEDVWMRNV